MAQLHLRPLGWPDLPALVALANREILREPESMPLTPERLRSWLTAPGVDLAEDGRGVEAGGQLAAWAALLADVSQRACGRGFLRGPSLDDAAHPGTAEALVRWAIERARRIGLRTVVGTAWEFEREKRALFERCGFREAHRYHRMKLFEMGFLPMPAIPAGVEIRQVDPDQDVEAVVHTVNQAFAGAWDFAPETPATVHHALTAPHDPTERVFLAWRRDEPVGICWTGARPAAGGRPWEVPGWIEALGVVPGFRRRGLGRALLLYGLLSLWDHGILSAGLTVDGDNHAALRLYQELGFTEVATYAQSLIEVKP